MLSICNLVTSIPTTTGDFGSAYCNYKHFHSIVLMAVVDSDYKFMNVYVGANGAGSDGGVFMNTEIRQCFKEGSLGLPLPSPLPGGDTDVGYFLVGDEAFPLKTWLMKPLPSRNLTVEQRIYNYRLSRARRVVENAFGILAHRFRCLLTTLQQSPKKVEALVLACCLLHNLMRTRYPMLIAEGLDREDPVTHHMQPGAWRQEEVTLRDVTTSGGTKTAY
ncbi:hypothetical protein HAZT_HAZT010340 [Hyalella azteca]|uniref:DDE Tnp4 domain-containing protein n=1 Tax=Hyalella azteca TaxID=294128 RepID=A0A6A0GM34_HYAAZ|nr:hypothetical protein HAZT_HAZT010340 [Hyalella azteca]